MMLETVQICGSHVSDIVFEGAFLPVFLGDEFFFRIFLQLKAFEVPHGLICASCDLLVGLRRSA
jgi:hypothetical protein